MARPWQPRQRLVAFTALMAVLGLPGLVIFALPAIKAQKEAQQELDAGAATGGRWFVEWGYLLVVPVAVAGTFAVPYFLLTLVG